MSPAAKAPSLHEQQRFTKIIDVTSPLSFSTGRFLDIIARKELWQNGLDYRHGTGHGIGMFLGVHEGEMRQDIELEWDIVTKTQ